MIDDANKLSVPIDWSKELRTGDKKVFERFYTKHFPLLCAYASRFIPQIECEGVVQNTMIWLWNNRKTLLPNHPVLPLLYTITRNKCLHIKSHESIKSKVELELQQTYAKQYEMSTYEMEELQQQLKQAIDELPETYRHTFMASRNEGLTYQQIADRENISLQTVNYRISKSLNILRLKLSDYLICLIFFFYFQIFYLSL